MMEKRYLDIIIILVVTNSCVSPYDVSTQFQEAIVVQGMITDQPGPYLIQVSKTISIDNQSGTDSSAVTGASVVIKDDHGNSEQLTETSPGYLYTKTIQGVVGNTYTVTVTLHDGSVYQSTPQTMLPVGAITNVRYQFVQNEFNVAYPINYWASLAINTTNGFNVFIDCTVLPEQQNRVWWRWSGTYHIITFPAYNPLDGEPRLKIYDSYPCSGFIHNFIPLGKPCSCCDCWMTEYNQTPLISNSKFISNGQINNYNVAFVEANRRTMYDKYVLQIEQLSLSEDVYNFWNVVSVQMSNSSSSNLFQTPSPKTPSNLTAQTPNALPIIGYFAACAVQKQMITFDKSEMPYTVAPIDTVTKPCTKDGPNPTTKRPSFW